jgi:hypothetical protein
MPLSSALHVPALMGEDDKYINYGCNSEDYDAEGQETRTMSDGVCLTMAKRKTDGKMGVVKCSFPKDAYDADKAKAWMEGNKNCFSIKAAELFSIKDVEIFSTGTWNGRHITDIDLDNIVDAFSSTNQTVRPFLKLGHSSKQKILEAEGLPAAGWVTNVRRVGNKLKADFIDLPRKIYQLIKNKAYRKVSCEIYSNITLGDRTYPKLLGGVALLGAELPGVLNLNDILSLYQSNASFSSVENFATEGSIDIITSDIYSNEDQEMPTVEELQAELAKKDAELKAAAAERDDFKVKAEKAESEKAETAQALLEAQAKVKEESVAKFVTELKAEKLCSKAMEPLVSGILLEKELFSADKKPLSKQEALREVLKFAKEAAKVNFEEKTADAKETEKPNLEAEIEKYASEHRCDYTTAYRAVMKANRSESENIDDAEDDSDED